MGKDQAETLGPVMDWGPSLENPPWKIGPVMEDWDRKDQETLRKPEPTDD